jgi:hypothetical protein
MITKEKEKELREWLEWGHYNPMHDLAIRALDELDALQAENARLREALSRIACVTGKTKMREIAREALKGTSDGS